MARRTFYRLYQGKEEVLFGYFERLCLDYKERYGGLLCYDVRQISGEFFGFWYEHKELLLLLYERKLDGMLYNEIGRSSLEVVRSRMAGDGGKRLENREGVEYFAAYSAGGFVNLLRQWVDVGMRGTPEEYGRKVGEALERFLP